MRTPNKSRGPANANPVSGHLLRVAVLALVSPSLLAATIVKNNNNDALNLGSSWVGGTAPGTVDTAQWDATLTAPANCTNVLGGDLSWSGIKIVAPVAPVEIDGANTLTLTNLDLSAATVDLTLNCGLDVEGTPTWLIASGRTLNLGSAMTGAGNIKQQGGTVHLAPGTGALPSTMTYSFAGASALDLGGNSQTLNLMIPSWGATNRVSNGDLTLTLSSGDYNPLTQNDKSTEDLTGLSRFTVNNTARNFSFNSAGTTGGIGIYLYLARTNFLAVSAINVGTVSSASSGASPISYLYLGQSNVINAGNFTVCGYRASGQIQFNGGLSNPYLKLRAANGTSRVVNWIVGKYTSGSTSGFGTMDLTGGTLDCIASILMVGEQGANANTAATGTLVIDGSTSSVEVQTSATIAQKDSGTGTPAVTGTLRQLAGSVKIASLTVGNNLGSSSGVTIKAAYQMGDGALRLKSMQGGTVGASENANSFRTFFWTNGVIQNFDAANGMTVQGPLVISAAGSGNRYLRTDASLQNTIACALRQSAGASPIVADGAGTLDLQGSDDNAYLGLNVSNGIVSLDKASSSSVHAIGSSLSLNGGSVYLASNGGSGGDQIYDGCVVALNSGSLNLYGQTETIAGLTGSSGALADSVGGGNLTLNVANGTNYISGATLNQGSLTIGLAVGGGTGTQILTGTDNRTSESTTINSGTLQIGNGGSGNLAGGSVVVNSPGRLVYDQSGTAAFTGSFSGTGDVVLNGTGTVVLGNDSHTGQTLVNAGTLQAAPGASSVGGSLIRVSAGATLDLSPGSPVALAVQQLTGAGTVNGSFFLGSGALLSGTLTLTGGDVSTGDTSTNAPGGFSQAGTLTVNGNYNCGYNSYLVYDLASATTTGSGVNDLMNISGNLDLSQPCTLIVKGAPQTGTYTLATFGSFSGSAANLTVIGSPRITFSPRVSGNTLLLDVTGSVANLAWQGDGAGNAWDNSLLSVWLNLGTSAADVFYPADNVVFNDSSANPTVNINDTVLPGSVLVNAAQDYTFAGSGDISGNIALTKTNTGTLTIQNNNSFTGPVNVNGGTVSVASVAPSGAQPLGAGTALNLNGGAWQYTGPAVDLGGFNRDITLGANGGTIDQESSAGIYFFLTNRIAGGGSLTKAGAQQLILGDAASGAGSNTYSGGTYINAGNLQIRNAAALGTNSVWINPGGSLSEDGGFAGAIANNIILQGGNLGGGLANYTFNGTVTIATNSTVGFSALTLAGPVTGSSALNVSAGTVTLLNDNNNYAGGTFINTNATLQLGTNGPSGWLAAPPVDQPLTNNGALVFNSSLTNVVGFSITGTGNVVQNGVGYTVLTGTNTFSGTLAVNGTTGVGGGILLSNSQAAGTGLINIAGINYRSTLQLAGGITVNNDFLISQRPNGSTAPHIANIDGTNTLAGLMTLTSGGNLWMLSANAGQMIVSGISNSVGGFARTLYLQGAASGVVTNLIDGSQAWLQLIKSGAGTWTLAGPASIGAGIQVNAGTLIVDGNVDGGTAAGNATVSGGNLIVNGTLPGTVTVSNTAALGGAGIITNAVTVQAGGTLAPGLASAASTATLTLNSDLTLAGNAWFKLNKALGQSNDFVVVNGALNNTGAANVLTVSNAGPALVAGDKFTLFSQPLAGGGSLTVTGGGSGVTWANNLAADGSITVLTASPVVNTNSFAVGAVVSGNSLNLSWPSDRLGWMVQIQTNTVGAGLGTNWVTLTNSAAGTNYSLPISPANPSVFIRMVYP